MVPLTAKKWLWHAGPWALSCGIIVAILYRYPLDEIAYEMERGDVVAMWPYVLGLPVVLLFLLAAWDHAVIRAAIGKLKYFDVVRAKAGVSLLMVLGYGFSHGGYGVWVARKTGTNVRMTFGLIVYIMCCDLAAVSAVATLGVWMSDFQLPARIRIGVGTIGPLITGTILIAGLVGPKIAASWQRVPQILHPWSQVAAGVFLLSVTGRGINIVIMTAATWAAADAFGLAISMEAMFVYLPIIMLVGSLPINVLGFGAVQAAWLVFETAETSGEQILAFQFMWHMLVSIAVLLRGAPFVRGIYREIAGFEPAAQ